MKMKFVVGLFTLFVVAAMSYAQPTQSPSEPVIKGTLDLSFTTLYVWRGFQVFGSKTAIHPSIDLFNPDTNFGFDLTVHRANSGGYEKFERWDYNFYYLAKLFGGDPAETDFRFGYVYYNFPQESSSLYDLQELNMVMSLPKLIPVEGLVPSYVLVKLWPSSSGSLVGAKSGTGGTASGFAHIFMLDYALPYVCPFTGVDRKLNLHAEAVYNDGVSPTGSNVDHDWSNAVFGATTTYELLDNLFLTPGVFYQSTWDKSVNPGGDQTWGSLSLSWKF
jgi:hypothetical protein